MNVWCYDVLRVLTVWVVVVVWKMLSSGKNPKRDGMGAQFSIIYKDSGD
jgi:hypothetical protein